MHLFSFIKGNAAAKKTSKAAQQERTHILNESVNQSFVWRDCNSGEVNLLRFKSNWKLLNTWSPLTWVTKTKKKIWRLSKIVITALTRRGGCAWRSGVMSGRGRNVGCRWKRECRLGCVVTLHTTAWRYNKMDPRGRRSENAPKQLHLCVRVFAYSIKLLFSNAHDWNHATQANLDDSSWHSVIHNSHSI